MKTITIKDLFKEKGGWWTDRRDVGGKKKKRKRKKRVWSSELRMACEVSPEAKNGL